MFLIMILEWNSQVNVFDQNLHEFLFIYIFFGSERVRCVAVGIAFRSSYCDGIVWATENIRTKCQWMFIFE